MDLSAFSKSYAEARDKVLATSTLDHVGFDHPLKGPDGGDIATDVLLAHEDRPKMLVLNSATHGIEGYAGSACQIAALRSGLVDRLPEDVGLMIIHAINPHGFSWGRRVNEDNVDLNRNFIDFDAPLPDFPAYRDHAEAINPRSLDDESWAAANATLTAYLEQHGAFALQELISAGQYIDPDGVYFGGQKATWSRRTLEAITDNWLADKSHMVFIDYHTGLGPEGHGELITEVPADHPLYQRAHGWWGDRVTSTSDGSSTSAQLTGTIDWYLIERLGADRVTPAALEYGTQSTASVGRALRRDNWLYRFAGGESDMADEIRSDVRAAFYVETDDWKAKILQQSQIVIDQALSGLQAL